MIDLALEQPLFTKYPANTKLGKHLGASKAVDQLQQWQTDLNDLARDLQPNFDR